MLKGKKKINWILTQATHYHTDLIDKVHKAGNIELYIVYYSKMLTGYPWKNELADFKNQYIVKKSFFNIDFKLLFQWLRKSKNDFFIFAGWAEITSVLFLTYCAIFKLNYIIQTDTPQINKPQTLFYFLRGKWLNFILSRSVAILVTGEIGIEEIKKICSAKLRIFNFPFIVNLDAFKFERPVFSSSEIRIFSSGRLVNNHKGYLVMLNAIALLRDKMPNLKFKYIIAGEGPDKMIIKNFIRELNLEKYVELIGWVEIEELPGLYNNCDIFLHISYFDPYPNAVLEAMACGRIILASSSAGSAKDRIVHGQNGFLTEPGDYLAAADQLCKIIYLDDVCKQDLSQRARLTTEMWDYKYNLSVLNEVLDIK